MQIYVPTCAHSYFKKPGVANKSGFKANSTSHINCNTCSVNHVLSLQYCSAISTSQFQIT